MPNFKVFLSRLDVSYEGAGLEKEVKTDTKNFSLSNWKSRRPLTEVEKTERIKSWVLDMVCLPRHSGGDVKEAVGFGVQRSLGWDIKQGVLKWYLEP